MDHHSHFSKSNDQLDKLHFNKQATMQTDRRFGSLTDVPSAQALLGARNTTKIGFRNSKDHHRQIIEEKLEKVYEPTDSCADDLVKQEDSQILDKGSPQIPLPKEKKKGPIKATKGSFLEIIQEQNEQVNPKYLKWKPAPEQPSPEKGHVQASADLEARVLDDMALNSTPMPVFSGSLIHSIKQQNRLLHSSLRNPPEILGPAEQRPQVPFDMPSQIPTSPISITNLPGGTSFDLRQAIEESHFLASKSISLKATSIGKARQIEKAFPARSASTKQQSKAGKTYVHQLAANLSPNKKATSAQLRLLEAGKRSKAEEMKLYQDLYHTLKQHKERKTQYASTAHIVESKQDLLQASLQPRFIYSTFLDNFVQNRKVSPQKTLTGLYTFEGKRVLLASPDPTNKKAGQQLPNRYDELRASAIDSVSKNSYFTQPIQANPLSGEREVRGSAEMEVRRILNRSTEQRVGGASLDSLDMANNHQRDQLFNIIEDERASGQQQQQQDESQHDLNLRWSVEHRRQLESQLKHFQ